MKASFFVHGTAIPKARPRVVRRKNAPFPTTYTPKSTVQWERTVAAEYRRQCGKMFFDRGIPLRFYAEIVMPGSGSSATIRGDWENHAKSLCDALNEVAYADDAQIVDGRTVKRRARKGEAVGVHIQIEAAAEVQSGLFQQQAEDLPPWEKAS